MSEYTKEEIEQAKEDIRKMSEKTRSEPTYTGKAYSDTGPRPGVKQGGFGGSGGGGDFGSGLQKMNKDLKRNYKDGGKVSSASKRADGCCIKGKTKGKML